MTKLQILFRINEMTGKSITLNQALEVMETVEITVEVLEKEKNEFDMDQLIRDMIDEIVIFRKCKLLV
jgi:hypothetical protein